MFSSVFLLCKGRANGLRYPQVGGRGLCLGAGKTRSQKNPCKPRRIPSVQCTLKDKPSFYTRERWSTQNGSKMQILVEKAQFKPVFGLRSENALLGIFMLRYS